MDGAIAQCGAQATTNCTCIKFLQHNLAGFNTRETPVKFIRYQRLFCIFGFILLVGNPLNLHADTPEYEPVHWAYSTFFGTGWYEIGDNRSIFVLRIPPRQTVRESGFKDNGKRKIGVEIKYPLTLGFHNIEDIPGFVQPDNFGTVSFTPGVELEIPVNDRWYLRPFAHIGLGTDLDSDESVWIYYTGIKSRYTFTGRKLDWALLNSLNYVGYTPDKGRSDSLATAQLGLEVRHPLQQATLAGRNIDLHYNFMYSFLGNELHFGLPDGGFDVVEDQLEIGIAASFRDRPYKLWFLNVHRLGLGYKFTSEGDFKAITISMRSWFTR